MQESLDEEKAKFSNSKKAKNTNTKKCCGGNCGCDHKKASLSLREYLEHLNQVIDPETGIGIVDMGLIYDVVEEDDGKIYVEMTFTSVACPMGPQIVEDVMKSMRQLDHVKEVDVNVVWEPAWSSEMMNPEVKAMLFGN
ncbi:DUF59 domain-containing protein [Candidatus Peregrinibacteria bacterium]|nr:DUF59 domain-containing protein [Candidatus Peregrinibacteria bacterium]